MATEVGAAEMELRVVKLEQTAQQTREHLARIDGRLDSIELRMATREDVLRLEARMHEALSALTWKLIGTMGALVAGVYFVARTVH